MSQLIDSFTDQLKRGKEKAGGVDSAGLRLCGLSSASKDFAELLFAFAFDFCRLRNLAATPVKPVPSNNKVAGSGTAVWLRGGNLSGQRGRCCLGQSPRR